MKRFLFVSFLSIAIFFFTVNSFSSIVLAQTAGQPQLNQTASVISSLQTIINSLSSIIHNSDFLTRSNPSSQLAQVSGSGADVTSGLIGYWNMDSDTINWPAATIVDRTGNGYTGTLVGFNQADNALSGKFGQALQFNGTSNYIDSVSLTDDAYFSNTTFSVSLWLKSTAINTSAGYCLVCKGGSKEGWRIRFNTTGLVRAESNRIGDGGNGSASRNSTVSVVDGRWHHVVAIFTTDTTTADNNSINLYVDGVLNQGKLITGIYVPTALSVKAGTVNRSSFYNGALDDIRIFSRALSADEVHTLYQTTSFDTPVLTAPAAPQGLASPSHTADSVSLSWNANTETDLINYKLYQNDIQVASFGKNETSYKATGLAPSTAYRFQLSALNSWNMEGIKSATVIVTTDAAPQGTIVTPAQYLAGLTHPSFKPGNTLPPLTRWGGLLSYDHGVAWVPWGYALGFDASPAAVAKLSDPNSYESRVTALVRSNPSIYKLFTLMYRTLSYPLPDDAYLRDPSGNLYIPKKVSPEAPDSIIESAANSSAALLRQVADKAPISIVLNGGETGMGNYGWNGENWKQNSAIVAAKGSMSWDDYQSQRKAHQEMFFTRAARAVANNAPYIFYPTGNWLQRNGVIGPWDFDYRWMKDVVDYPGASMYYREYNSGYVPSAGTTNADMLTQVLNGHGYVAPMGDTLSYNWVNNGWDGHGFGDNTRYYGFLKSYYTSGMIGGIAGYFGINWWVYRADMARAFSNGGEIFDWLLANNYFYGGTETEAAVRKLTDATRALVQQQFPGDSAAILAILQNAYDQSAAGRDASFDSNSPPQRLLQMMALSQVHAEFSYLEDMLRNGDLLPGQGQNKLSNTQPAYEFYSGYDNTRVLVRKMRGQKRWLISAWAADNVTRTVSVTIPVLGAVSVAATPSGSLYDARVVNGAMSLTQIDNGSQNPTPLSLPSSTPDSDGSAYVPSPVLGSCSTTLNSCAAGTFSDLTDTSTNYLWQCLGLNGGSTTSCSLNISTYVPPTYTPSYTQPSQTSPSTGSPQVGEGQTTSICSSGFLTLTPLGNNPAYLAKGAGYRDPGVSVSGTCDLIYFIQASVNGGKPVPIGDLSIDTSLRLSDGKQATSTVSTITYTMTDSYGKSATATRTIFVTLDGKPPLAASSALSGLPLTGQVPSVASPSSPSTSNFELSTLSTPLSRGSTGSEVTKLQTFLISQNLLTPSQATGYFGPATEKAVRTFQVNQQIPNDPGSSVPYGSGFVGTRTLARINQVITNNQQPTTANQTGTGNSQQTITNVGTNVVTPITATSVNMTREELIAYLKAQIVSLQQQLIILLQEIIRAMAGSV